MFEVLTEFKAIRMIRFDPGQDLLVELRKYVNTKKIKNAVILNGIGSSKSYSYHVVSSPDIPPEEIYPKAKKALDIVSVQGFVLDGRVHTHIVFSDEKISFGGHLEEGVVLLTFAIITLGIVDDDIDISRWDVV
jgi:predicted DNA-binding protein with PD1-like motif